MPTVFFGSSESARSFSSAEKTFFLHIINDVKSWPVGHWTNASTKASSDWIVVLEKDSFIEKIIKQVTGKTEEKGLSVTFMSVRPRITAFSYENWTRVPRPLEGLYTIEDYRTYVINHELGHVLGHNHPRKPRELSTFKAPIMIQHTKGIGIFHKNLWPLANEKIKKPTLL